MSPLRHPALYQINTRVWLTDLSRGLGRPATLDDISDTELDRVAGIGFDWVWLLSVWRTGPAGQRVSRANREWRREFEEWTQLQGQLRESRGARSRFFAFADTVSARNYAGTNERHGWMGSMRTRCRGLISNRACRPCRRGIGSWRRRARG